MFSCETKTSTTSTEVNKNEKHTKDMDMVYRAIETGNTAGLDSIMDPNIIDHGSGHDVKGADSVKMMLADIHNHFTNLKFENLSTASNNDYVFTLVRMTGTASDNVMGFAPGASVSSTSIDVVKIDANGKATEHWAYMDPNEMMKMMAGTPPVTPPAKKEIMATDTAR